MNFVKAGSVAAILLTAACGSAPTNNAVATVAPANTVAPAPAPAAAAGNGAAPAAGNTTATAGDPELRGFIVGRWDLAGTECRAPAEFRADGGALRVPGAQVDRWALENRGGRNVLVITASGDADEGVEVSREGNNLAVRTPDGRSVTLTRCPAA